MFFPITFLFVKLRHNVYSNQIKIDCGIVKVVAIKR